MWRAVACRDISVHLSQSICFGVHEIFRPYVELSVQTESFYFERLVDGDHFLGALVEVVLAVLVDCFGLKVAHLEPDRKRACLHLSVVFDPNVEVFQVDFNVVYEHRH